MKMNVMNIVSVTPNWKISLPQGMLESNAVNPLDCSKGDDSSNPPKRAMRS
jgi:hypothetical protein